jgi:maltooligosyltrehalose trehalohydrolase
VTSRITNLTLGATWTGHERLRFRVWAPYASKVSVHIHAPEERRVEMERRDRGYHQATVDGAVAGTSYTYILERAQGAVERPDPASRFQPEGVHRCSQAAGAHFVWDDANWCGLPLEDYVFYEIHVGTYTPEGTFDAVIPHLDDLKDLGVTALQLMPVAQFAGERNWGYDGAYPFAVQNSYGGPEGLRRLINACHSAGFAVALDVVYNHLGPEGNYLADFGPYFTGAYNTPWGKGVNFDGPWSDEVRRFFIENALYWITEFHIDALRLDAAHAIFDRSAHSFLEELGEAVHFQAQRLNRRIYVIPESDLNDPRLIRAREQGGCNLDAQWNDDFHHALHALLTGERTGYYQDFGGVRHLAKAFTEGFVYSGEYSQYRKRRFGGSSRDMEARRFVVFAQNHDQVGNRMLGERLSRLAGWEQLKLAAGAVLLSPYVPLIFMGEEYGETAPFLYFVSHSDPELAAAVLRGRREEFADWGWQGEIPDPQSEMTFFRSKLNHQLQSEPQHHLLLQFYKELIRLRKTLPALALMSKKQMAVFESEAARTLVVHRWAEGGEALAAFNFGASQAQAPAPVAGGCWEKQIDSADRMWGGQGSFMPSRLNIDKETPLSLQGGSFLVFARRAHD